MDYPIWYLPYFGGAMVIASIAIVHVFIAHFAVGAGLFNAIAETHALRHNDTAIQKFLRDNSKLIILLPLIGGVVTGVGIWFSISIVSPETTSILIHLFLWAWALEWLLFTVEIISGYLYYYTWKTISPRAHCFIGWVYAVSAFLSLVVINGILTFMITPGHIFDSSTTPFTFSFWPGLFNPAYWPSLILRTISALTLGALFALVLINASRKYTPAERDRLTQLAGKALLPLVLAIPAAVWYFFRCPPLSLSYLTGGSVVMGLLFAFALVGFTLIAFYSYTFIIVRKHSVTLGTALLLLILAFIATGASEFVREGMRKPYLIWNHVYSNGILKSQAPAIRDTLTAQQPIRREATIAQLRDLPYTGPVPNDTVLRFHPWAINPIDVNIPIVTDPQAIALELGLTVAQLPLDRQGAHLAEFTISEAEFYTQDPLIFANLLRQHRTGQAIRGQWIYNAQCLRCHDFDGYNAIKPLVRNWTPTMLARSLEHLESFRGFMPPFFGSPNDRDDLAYFMHTLDGQCSRCHETLDDQANRVNLLPITAKDNWEPLP
ncbi:MAG: cytochrome ubiquinol oxidase subunit I [Sedimentisphaerales bacterium]|nr:cytochrome ubiquinol oxidase subunit I [Sedimentisphaerales bacterium]